jgi:c-di-GMP-binding flagellar brake protein YcgR
LKRGQEQEWSITGQTIDISGSGILAIFDEKPPRNKQVVLEITTPTPNPQTIKVLAHPVRQKQEVDGRYEVAYHFDDISTKDRDTIIGCCLALQRKMLQLKVQVKDN